MSIACVLVTHLPLKIELLRQPALRGKAVLVIEQSGTQKLVIDRSSAAHETEVGMSLENARARCTQATLIEAETLLYRERWSRILPSVPVHQATSASFMTQSSTPIMMMPEGNNTWVLVAGLESNST